MANPITDYFAIEPLLIQQIRENVPGLQHVGQMTNTELALKDRGLVPAVYVSLFDLQPLELDDQTRRLYEMELTYQVILAVSNRRDTRHNYDVNREAGPILALISKAILNKDMHQDYTRFRLVRSPDFRKYLAGHGVFTMAYATTFTATYDTRIT